MHRIDEVKLKKGIQAFEDTVRTISSKSYEGEEGEKERRRDISDVENILASMVFDLIDDAGLDFNCVLEMY